MKVCIVSDSHDRGEMLARAIETAAGEGAEAVIHCGDLVGGNTLRESLRLGLPIHAIHGNNLGDPVALARMAHRSDGTLTYYGEYASISLGGRRIFVTHYPHYGHAMACTGDYDLICCGHSHETEVRTQPHIGGGDTWLVNPGTVAGMGAAPATWVMGDLEDMAFEIRATSPG